MVTGTFARRDGVVEMSLSAKYAIAGEVYKSWLRMVSSVSNDGTRASRISRRSLARYIAVACDASRNSREQLRPLLMVSGRASAYFRTADAPSLFPRACSFPASARRKPFRSPLPCWRTKPSASSSIQELRDVACNILAIYDAPTASSSSNATSIRIFVTLSRFIVLFIFFPVDVLPHICPGIGVAMVTTRRTSPPVSNLSTQRRFQWQRAL